MMNYLEIHESVYSEKFSDKKTPLSECETFVFGRQILLQDIY